MNLREASRNPFDGLTAGRVRIQQVRRLGFPFTWPIGASGLNLPVAGFSRSRFAIQRGSNIECTRTVYPEGVSDQSLGSAAQRRHPRFMRCNGNSLVVFRRGSPAANSAELNRHHLVRRESPVGRRKSESDRGGTVTWGGAAAHARRVYSEHGIGLSAPISAESVQNKQPLVARLTPGFDL
jgi:hypothetical protein